MTVLVLRALGLGDFFTGLPALAMLRRALPDERIVLAVPDSLRELALLSGSVDATVHGNELQPLRDPPRAPQLAIDLHGNGPASRHLLELTDPERLVAYGRDGLRWDACEHEVERWCRLVREGLPAVGMASPPVCGALPVPRVPSVPLARTVVHCGAKFGSRRWPAERFVTVAAELRRQGHDVVITGGPAEQARAGKIAADAGVQEAGLLTLVELVALVAAARLVVSADTGVAHVASAYGRPSVVLFGPVSPRVWGPPPSPCHQVIWHGNGTGNPHAAEIDPALARITPAEVLDASARALGQS